MLTVQVSRWSQAAASLLPPQQAVIGWVHSCYARIINVRTPGERLLTLQGEGMLQAPLGLALATDVAALGTHLAVGALVVQDIPTARISPAALQPALCRRPRMGRTCAGAAWTDPVGAGRQSARAGCLALPPHPYARAGATPAGPGAWADGPLGHQCSSVHGAGTAVCSATSVYRPYTAHPGAGPRRPRRRVNAIWRRLPRWPPGRLAYDRLPAMQRWFLCT